MTTSKGRTASESKFLFTVKEINLYNAQVIEQLKRNNLQLIEKWKSELIKLENDLKKSDFGVLIYWMILQCI